MRILLYVKLELQVFWQRRRLLLRVQVFLLRQKPLALLHIVVSKLLSLEGSLILQQGYLLEGVACQAILKWLDYLPIQHHLQLDSLAHCSQQKGLETSAAYLHRNLLWRCELHQPSRNQNHCLQQTFMTLVSHHGPTHPNNYLPELKLARTVTNPKTYIILYGHPVLRFGYMKIDWCLCAGP